MIQILTVMVVFMAISTSFANDTLTVQAIVSKLGLTMDDILFETENGKVTSLSITDQGIPELPLEIGNLTDLINLELDRNNLEELPDALVNCTLLQTLYVSHNKLTTLPDSIGKLDQIRIIDIAHNDFVDLPDSIGTMGTKYTVQVKEKDGTRCLQWYTFHTGDTECVREVQLYKMVDKMLPKKMYLDSNHFCNYQYEKNAWSAWLYAIRREGINDQDCNQDVILSNIAKDMSLSIDSIEIVKNDSNQIISLTIKEKGLTELTPTISRLPNLKEINVSGNSLTEIPWWMFYMRSLTHADFSHNSIDSMNSMFPDSIIGISSIDLSHNSIRTAPKFLGDTNTVQWVNLSYNEILEIPEYYYRYGNLNSLNIGHNKIEEISEALIQFSKLTELDISNNKVSTLPDVFSEVSDLTHLDVTGNTLTLLPNSLAGITPFTTAERQEPNYNEETICIEYGNEVTNGGTTYRPCLKSGYPDTTLVDTIWNIIVHADSNSLCNLEPSTEPWIEWITTFHPNIVATQNCSHGELESSTVSTASNTSEVYSSETAHSVSSSLLTILESSQMNTDTISNNSGTISSNSHLGVSSSTGSVTLPDSTISPIRGHNTNKSSTFYILKPGDQISEITVRNAAYFKVYTIHGQLKLQGPFNGILSLPDRVKGNSIYILQLSDME